jgi:hypothetical protein
LRVEGQLDKQDRGEEGRVGDVAIVCRISYGPGREREVTEEHEEVATEQRGWDKCGWKLVDQLRAAAEAAP